MCGIMKKLFNSVCCQLWGHEDILIGLEYRCISCNQLGPAWEQALLHNLSLLEKWHMFIGALSTAFSELKIKAEEAYKILLDLYNVMETNKT